MDVLSQGDLSPLALERLAESCSKLTLVDYVNDPKGVAQAMGTAFGVGRILMRNACRNLDEYLQDVGVVPPSIAMPDPIRSPVLRNAPVRTFVDGLPERMRSAILARYGFNGRERQASPHDAMTDGIVEMAIAYMKARHLGDLTDTAFMNRGRIYTVLIRGGAQMDRETAARRSLALDAPVRLAVDVAFGDAYGWLQANARLQGESWILDDQMDAPSTIVVPRTKVPAGASPAWARLGFTSDPDDELLHRLSTVDVMEIARRAGMAGSTCDLLGTMDPIPSVVDYARDPVPTKLAIRRVQGIGVAKVEALSRAVDDYLKQVASKRAAAKPQRSKPKVAGSRSKATIQVPAPKLPRPHGKVRQVPSVVPEPSPGDALPIPVEAVPTVVRSWKERRALRKKPVEKGWRRWKRSRDDHSQRGM
jgi:hypothetical protein